MLYFIISTTEADLNSLLEGSKFVDYEKKRIGYFSFQLEQLINFWERDQSLTNEDRACSFSWDSLRTLRLHIVEHDFDKGIAQAVMQLVES